MQLQQAHLLPLAPEQQLLQQRLTLHLPKKRNSSRIAGF
jgi:hypothetical protein